MYDLGEVVGATGAKGDTGNGIQSITKTGTSGKVDTYTITFTDGTSTTFQVTNGSDGSVTVDSSLSSTSVNPVQNKVIKGALDGKSDTGHTHDDRYYTESETDNLLSGKASSSHTHTKSQITDFPTIPSKTSDLTNDGADGSNVYVMTNDSRLSDSRTPTSHAHGQITNDGAMDSSAVVTVAANDTILISDSSDSSLIKRANNIRATHVKDITPHSNIGSVGNATQAVINAAIDTKIGDIETLIGDAILFINGTGGS